MELIQLAKVQFPRDASGELFNPRGQVHDTTDLQFSMTLLGQKEPIRGFWQNGMFSVVDGHRRVTAARALDWSDIKAEAEDAPASDSDLLVRMLAADVRERLSPMALARTYKRLLGDVNWSIERLSKAVGVAVPMVELHLALLGAPDGVQKRVDKGEMSWSAFKALRDQPVAVQETAAALPKPTVSAVRKTAQEAKQSAQSAQTHIEATMAVATKIEPLAAQFGALVAQIVANWDKLSELEQMRITSQAERLIEVGQQVREERRVA